MSRIRKFHPVSIIVFILALNLIPRLMADLIDMTVLLCTSMYSAGHSLGTFLKNFI
ncbi:hypothetical protein [Bacillus suaedae]|uniref:Uncharacterized protein n=1 Tax=Halalkalibacter suaedae TaxID=2822140 RepID=A0A940WSK6_9BACI|nr:hypothetical protein [Bacillus suaedae]MBP3951725.1 hypothetical protein [Bacillus suaedae]